ncbi:hypothetical protein ACJEBK_19705 [Peribacillus frigoritolerans]
MSELSFIDWSLTRFMVVLIGIYREMDYLVKLVIYCGLVIG